MGDFPIVNVSNLTTLQFPVSNTECRGQGGCESDLEASWIQYFLELVLLPSIGTMGVVGNLGSILVLAITDDKTTFKHVSCLYTVCYSILKIKVLNINICF